MSDDAKERQSKAILDAAARFYGQHIAQGGVQALVTVEQQLSYIIAQFKMENKNA